MSAKPLKDRMISMEAYAELFEFFGITDLCKTETDAARYFWENVELPLEMRNLPVIFFAIPMKWENGIPKRPTTADTIIGWVEKFPAPCSCLFISNQPHCGYQFAIIKRFLDV